MAGNNDNKFSDKKCFVIMPFGIKKEKRPDGTEVEINFDFVYKDLIKPAVESLGVICDRCDEIIDTGSIHSKMFNGIVDADVAVVDISFINPNVYYELGVRHALNKHVTLVIRKFSNTPPPFNISGLNVLGYDIDNEDKLNASRNLIREYIKVGLEKQSVDSLVHEYLDDLKVERKPKPISKKEMILYPLLNAPGKEIGLITGDIQNIKEVDVWVNSENTNMQMARHYERSISGTIRYMGAIKDQAKRVSKDVIAEELQKIVGKLDVDQGQVIATSSGQLKKTNKVKKIFHAAAVIGQVGRGYSPIPDIAECVRNSLALADQQKDVQSILFPLMGTGASKLDAQVVARGLLNAAISYLEENKKSKVKKVYFLAFNEQDKEICEHNYSLFIKEKRLGKRKRLKAA